MRPHVEVFPHQRRYDRSKRRGAVSVQFGVILLIVVLVGAFVVVLAATRTPSASPTSSHLAPAQGDQLYTFSACTAPDGSSCLSDYGGIVTPLAVGTTVSMEFFTSAFCTTPITGNVNWDDSSEVQTQTISSGPCQCEFGPFTHTFNTAGNFNPVIYDSCDGSEQLGTISVTNSADLFSFVSLLIILGSMLGLGAVIGGLVSMRRLRGSRRPLEAGGSASIEPVTLGYIPSGLPGVPGVTQSTAEEIWPPNSPPRNFPAWSTDYRTTPYQPNPLYTGWADYLQRYYAWMHQLVPPQPPSPVWPPAPQVSPPPTNYPGTFCQPRVNPATGRLAWWNPVDGTFPWGPAT